MIDLATYGARLGAALELRDIAKTLEEVAAGKRELISANWSVRYLRDMADTIEALSDTDSAGGMA